MKKKLILLVAVVMIFSVIAATAVACKKNETAIDSKSIYIDMEDNYYIGTEGSVDLSKAIPGGDGFQVTGDNVTLSGNTLSASAAGDFTITYTKDKKTVNGKGHAVEGVNITDWDGLAAANAANKTAVMQNDITSPDGAKPQSAVDFTLYGNGKQLIVNSVIKGNVKNRGNNLFNVEGNGKLNLNDVYFIGRVYGEGESVVLENCEGYGAFVNVTNDDNSKRPVVNIEHCIFENSHKHVYVRGADVNISGTIMRNGSDALLAIETSAVKGAVVNVENSVFAESVVCGIILCGWNAPAGDESYTTLNLKGFVDIYNWKSRDTASIMPATEGKLIADAVNGMVQSELGKDKNSHYFVAGDDGKQYVHFGVVILFTKSMQDDKANLKTKVTGLDSKNIAMVQKDFPIPSNFIVDAILKTCVLFGIDNNNITIPPTSKLTDNENLYTELIHGRA